MQVNKRQFLIHGDNIVECERTLHLIYSALKSENSVLRGPFGIATNPSFELVIDGGKTSLGFVFFPGFGRWNVDVTQGISERGGNIRELPDAIISEVVSEQEQLLMAIEYSAALAAGNQAWQRSGRAYSLGLALIPFLYIAELGGFELDKNRMRKAARFPNPAVPFSYLSHSSFCASPVLPSVVPNPEIDQAIRSFFSSAFINDEIIEFVRLVLLNEDATRVTEAIQEKAVEYVQMLSEKRRKGTLTPQQWASAYQAVKKENGDSLVSFLLRETSLRWSRRVSIKSLTVSAKELMRIASKLSIGLTSSDLPMCLVPPENREAFAKEVQKLYFDIDDTFLNWLQNNGPLAICWVTGFKPKGEDSRPDRGLPPLTRMLVGSDADILTVVYGPAPQEHWSQLQENPIDLANQNGLWESIMVISDAILADSATDEVTTHGFLRTHWDDTSSLTSSDMMPAHSFPVSLGEQDVDTIIHLVFGRFGAPHVFEGLCNPPGGDWSGMSLLTPDQSKELRWLSLPRVSGSNTKRPDHVLQLFGLSDRPIVLAFESKERARTIEPKIGPRLRDYIKNLLQSPASIERENNAAASWRHSNLTLGPGDLRPATAAAFLMQGDVDVTRVSQISETDLQIGIRFRESDYHCTIELFPFTNIGQTIAEFMTSISFSNIGLSVRTHQYMESPDLWATNPS